MERYELHASILQHRIRQERRQERTKMLVYLAIIIIGFTTSTVLQRHINKGTKSNVTQN